MAGMSALVSSLISLVTNLLPEVKNSYFAPSSSSTTQSPDAHSLEDDLNKLMRTLEWIKATLYDAEEREIRDKSVKLWLKEIKGVGHEAEYVIDKYMHEVYRAKVEARNAYDLNPRKRKLEEGSVGASCVYSVRVSDEIVYHIRDIRSRFDEITKDRKEFSLNEDDGVRRYEDVRFEASSSYLKSEVFGRNRDKETVIDLLFSNNYEGKIRVIPIVGKGGLGKTTLAQIVYDDERVKQNFDLFGWACVSENFNIERLMQELIESVTQNRCSLRSLSNQQGKLKKIVAGKKVFVVLDDVCNEDYDLWELFLIPFMSAIRVAFIVTTRSDRVAKIMQTTFSPFRIDYLSDKDSWSLFQHYSGINPNDHTDKLDIGIKITKKCGGLPLALKSISMLLRYENDGTWEEILENDLNEIFGENDILGALQISYTHMPTYLRPCFMYCSLFPKDYEYEVDEMVELWITQGYIEHKRGRTLEEIAFQYIVELRERSFIDPIYKGTSWKRFKIHDMVHDLARSNSGNEFYSLVGGGKQSKPPNEILHVYVDDCDEPRDRINLNNIITLILKLTSGSNYIDLSEAKKLRVLKLQYSNPGKNVVLPDFLFPEHLRFLELAYAIDGSLTIPLPISSLYHLERLNLNLNNSLVELDVLGNLTNLQYLSLSHCTASRFPDSMSNLARLQKLRIHACPGLCSLLDSLCEISSLKTLILTECSEITMFPNNIGSLTNLQSITISHCSSLRTIRGLEDLESLVELEIEYCEKLGSFPFELISQGGRWHKSSLSGLQKLGPLKKLEISCCPVLRFAVNEVVPSVHCNIEISRCEGMREWCLEHKISYKPEEVLLKKHEVGNNAIS